MIAKQNKTNIESKLLHAFKIFFIVIMSIIAICPVLAAPTSPSITYLSNSTYIAGVTNRSQDAKGTITTVTLSSIQQDYKWKAYVGNVSGRLSLDDASTRTIYDWSLGTVTGKVFVSRVSTINWANVSCVNQSVLDNEDTALGISLTARDGINATFNNTVHKSFLVGSKNITQSSCRAAATYVNDLPQAPSISSLFQEILLKDDITGSLVYTTIIDAGQNGYDNSPRDFQLLVAENESSSVPTAYYFFVELG